MMPEPPYLAVVCSHCERVALIVDDGDVAYCPDCGDRRLRVPGATFTKKDEPLFVLLERIVRDADLSKSEATLIAGELESVSARWEPPELVLQHLAPRLNGLSEVYDPQQEYPRLLLVVSMLLTVVCTRMLRRDETRERSRRPSGIRDLAKPSSAPVISVAAGAESRGGRGP